MTLSVRIPNQVEQDLAEYCVKNRVSKSEAVKRALDQFLAARNPTPYELGKDLFAARTDEAPVTDVARHTKKLLRERFARRAK